MNYELFTQGYFCNTCISTRLGLWSAAKLLSWVNLLKQPLDSNVSNWLLLNTRRSRRLSVQTEPGTDVKGVWIIVRSVKTFAASDRNSSISNANVDAFAVLELHSIVNCGPILPVGEQLQFVGQLDDLMTSSCTELASTEIMVAAIATNVRCISDMTVYSVKQKPELNIRETRKKIKTIIQHSFKNRFS